MAVGTCCCWAQRGFGRLVERPGVGSDGSTGRVAADGRVYYRSPPTYYPLVRGGSSDTHNNHNNEIVAANSRPTSLHRVRPLITPPFPPLLSGGGVAGGSDDSERGRRRYLLRSTLARCLLLLLPSRRLEFWPQRSQTADREVIGVSYRVSTLTRDNVTRTLPLYITRNSDYHLTRKSLFQFIRFIYSSIFCFFRTAFSRARVEIKKQKIAYSDGSNDE